ncbi:MAG TPA: type II secretion system protein [Candidatus Saccharimonadales bacterium]|nr:type II secretion system protein [Candidatus Saccharimonadales bacterium]
MMRRVNQGGFTIPELIIMMIVTTFLTLLVITFALNFWSSSATLQNDSDALTTRLNTGDLLREQLNAASNLINQNSIQDPNAGDADPTAGPAYWLLLHAVPQTVSMPTSGITPVFYFQAPSVDAARNFIMNGSQPYQDEFVLYMNGANKELLLRTLVNPAATGDRLKTSCPPALATASCPADKVMGVDVSSVALRYFSRSGNTIDYTSVVDPVYGDYIGPDFEAVEVVELTVNVHKKSIIHGGNDTSSEVIVRVALRNG